MNTMYLFINCPFINLIVMTTLMVVLKAVFNFNVCNILAKIHGGHLLARKLCTCVQWHGGVQMQKG